MSDSAKFAWGFAATTVLLFFVALSAKQQTDMYQSCMARTCSAGFPAWSYGPDRINPISGKSLGRGSDSACYCVVIAGDEPK